MMAMEEGRIRYIPSPVSGQQGKFVFDYFIKDHLGNVRMVLTEEVKQDAYVAATLEGDLANQNDAVTTESKYYDIKPDYIANKSEATGISDYPNNNGNPPVNPNPNSQTTALSQKLYKLEATGTGGVAGLGITLKVMTGDKINIYGKSYYFQNNTNAVNYPVPLSRYPIRRFRFRNRRHEW